MRRSPGRREFWKLRFVALLIGGFPDRPRLFVGEASGKHTEIPCITNQPLQCLIINRSFDLNGNKFF